MRSCRAQQLFLRAAETCFAFKRGSFEKQFGILTLPSLSPPTGAVSFLLRHSTGIPGVAGDQIAPRQEGEGRGLLRVCAKRESLRSDVALVLKARRGKKTAKERMQTQSESNERTWGCVGRSPSSSSAFQIPSPCSKLVWVAVGRCHSSSCPIPVVVWG